MMSVPSATANATSVVTRCMPWTFVVSTVQLTDALYAVFGQAFARERPSLTIHLQHVRKIAKRAGRCAGQHFLDDGRDAVEGQLSPQEPVDRHLVRGIKGHRPCFARFERCVS